MRIVDCEPGVLKRGPEMLLSECDLIHLREHQSDILAARLRSLKLKHFEACFHTCAVDWRLFLSAMSMNIGMLATCIALLVSPHLCRSLVRVRQISNDASTPVDQTG